MYIYKYTILNPIPQNLCDSPDVDWCSPYVGTINSGVSLWLVLDFVVHPLKSTWSLKITQLKRTFIFGFQSSIFQGVYGCCVEYGCLGCLEVPMSDRYASITKLRGFWCQRFVGLPCSSPERGKSPDGCAKCSKKSVLQNRCYRWYLGSWEIEL